MNTAFWGKSGWQFLHTLTFIYPESPTFGDKVKMRDFMNSLGFILPCKYCRLSFINYTNTLPIDNYLESRELLIEWLYKIHNKINRKLRLQGFCEHPNPELSSVYNHYTPIVEKIKNMLNDMNESHISHTTQTQYKIDKTQSIINYVCSLGYDFLGSIIFNYQSYYSNCHTGNEKIRIISFYQSFFNSIIPLLCSCLSKLCKEGKDCIANFTIPKFNIRSILTQNEPYTKLIKWFYKCNIICKNENFYKTQDEYEMHFRKHIVLSCDNPKGDKNDKMKSCRNSKSKKTMKPNKTIKHY